MMPLYIVLARADRAVVEGMQRVPLRYAGQHPYVGLRARPSDAVRRYNLTFPGGVSPEAHVMLELVFTTAGLARYCTEATEEAHGFVPRLTKRVYYDGGRDWGVWHFIGDLPLGEEEYIIPAWREITAGDMA